MHSRFARQCAVDRLSGMKRLSPYLPAVLSAFALAVFTAAFVCEYKSFKTAVIGWAKGDISSRSQQAAATLSQSLLTDDFMRIRQFGEMCAKDGFRLCVRNKAGGLFFDTAPGDTTPVFWGKGECGEYVVSVGVSEETVLRPFRRAATGFVLAGLVGTAGVLLFFFVIYRQRVRIRELSRLEKFRRDFIADVSHEIKTPLTGLLAASELLGEGGDLPDGCRAEAISMIGREARRLNALVQDILALSRLERGLEGRFDFALADLSEIAAESVSRFSARAAESGIRLEGDFAGPCRVKCDAAQISRAVDNLLLNAICHSGSKTVRVSTAVLASRAVVSVEDHGVGIAPEHRQRVFERFHRVDSSRSDKTGGSGLGLAIVRGIAALHGGEVRLEPAKPSGCIFSLHLPCA